MTPPFDIETANKLAIVYVSLAFRSSLDPPDGYLDEISRKVTRWTSDDVKLPDVQWIVRRAVSTVRGDSGRRALAESIRELGLLADLETRRAFLYDLVQLALHDDWYMHEEGRFISAVARRWDVHPAEEGRERLWSVMNSQTTETEWTPVHDLALIYLALAHRADDELSQRELDAITKKLAEWLPAALPSDVVIIVSEALHVYARGADDHLISRAVARVKQAVPQHQRSAIITDLEYVARADDVMLVEEKAIISELARAWGVEPARV